MRITLTTTLALLLSSAGFGQSVKSGGGVKPAATVNAEDRRLSMLADLQFLAADSQNLQQPLARASALVAVARAAWHVDTPWAKQLLRAAFDLTLPPEEERARLRDQRTGSIPSFPTPEGRARLAVRQSVLAVAARDHAFADELMAVGAEQLGKQEQLRGYAESAAQSAKAGDVVTASNYASRALQIDPSRTNVIGAISEIARRDRAAADALIVQYFSLLKTFPVSYDDQSDLRTSFMASWLVFPHLDRRQQDVPPPGRAVMRAYVEYVLDTVGRQQGAALQNYRLVLLSVWDTLRQYAPDLTDAFKELEVRTRRPDERGGVPTSNLEDEYRKINQRRVSDALRKDPADERAISTAIGLGEFAKARRLIDKLADGAQKDQYAELVNEREALSLAAKGDTDAAASLAARLNKAASALNVYPVIIEKRIAARDRVGASALVTQAVSQLKRADAAPATPPEGIPAAAIASAAEFDPVLAGMCRLAKLILPVDQALAFDVLDETIAAANHSTVDSAFGRVGFEPDVFAAFAAKDEQRSLLTAQTLKDRLRCIASVAAVYESAAERLSRAPKTQ